MKRKSTHQNSLSFQAHALPFRVSFSTFAFLGVVLFVVYLWGKVQIEFAVRKNARLKQDCLAIRHNIDDLRVEINTLKSYPRISVLAKEYGLVFLPPDRIEDLPVDLSGLKPNPIIDKKETVLAGIQALEQKSDKQLRSWISGGADGTR